MGSEMCIRDRFLADNPTGGVLYFESESAITKQMIEQREIDTTRMVILPVATIQEFAHQVTKILDKHLESEDPKPLMICLDSLGMLSTSKEVGDIAEGKETKDMTRAALCLLYTSPSPRDATLSRMPSSA